MAEKEKVPEEKKFEELGTIREEIEEKKVEALPAEEKPKRRRRKKPKPPPEPEAPAIEMSTEDTRSILQMVTDYVAERKGEHWKMSKKEADQMAELVNRVIVKRAPKIAEYSEELALGMCVIAYFLPRLQIERALILEGAESAE